VSCAAILRLWSALRSFFLLLSCGSGLKIQKDWQAGHPSGKVCASEALLSGWKSAGCEMAKSVFGLVGDLEQVEQCCSFKQL